MKKLAILFGALTVIGGADAKTLVVYYSASGTTQHVAQVIAESTDGDLWQLEPVQPYTTEDLDYNDDNSRVKSEYASGNPHTELKNAVVDNWAEYDTVFIGAPVWWYKASWVINDFLKQNDFGDKRVVPFCTSGSTPYGNIGTEMQKLAMGGNWVDGARFGSDASTESIQEFVTRVTK